MRAAGAGTSCALWGPDGRRVFPGRFAVCSSQSCLWVGEQELHSAQGMGVPRPPILGGEPLYVLLPRDVGAPSQVPRCPATSAGLREWRCDHHWAGVPLYCHLDSRAQGDLLSPAGRKVGWAGSGTAPCRPGTGTWWTEPSLLSTLHTPACSPTWLAPSLAPGKSHRAGVTPPGTEPGPWTGEPGLQDRGGVQWGCG